METKKNRKFDLESKRKLFFLTGLIISLTLILLAFRGTTEVKEIEIPTSGFITEPEPVIIPITREPAEKKIALPKFKLYNEIVIVENEVPMPEADFTFDEPGDPLPDPIKVKEEADEESIVLFPHQMPEFPGGMKSLNRWLSMNIKYPETAQEMNIAGRVYLNFVVDKDGSISNIKITRGVDPLLDQEAIRVISSMPKWKPGLQNGKPVRVAYNIFVTFQLN